MVEMMEDRIKEDIQYYVTEIFPNFFWDFIDDEKLKDDFLSSEIEYYIDDFNHLYDDTEPIVEYIKNNIDDEQIPENIEEMDILELSELMDQLNIKSDFVEADVRERYENETAKDIHNDLYGDSDNITREIYQQYEWYFDEDRFANFIASEHLDESELSEELGLDEY
jgi:hypothetical protein